jgi:hypothetical protein
VITDPGYWENRAVLEKAWGGDLGTSKISGGPIEPFAGGWAILCFVGRDSKEHYWRKMKGVAGAIYPSGSVTGYESLCHARGGVSERTPALGRGTFPRCKVCQRIATRMRIK